MADDNNPLYPFYRDGKFGFFNRDFKEVIPPTYSSGNPHEDGFGNFSEGFALVRRMDLHYAFIDKQGVELDAQWSQQKPINAGFVTMLNQHGWGFMDPARKHQPREFSEGLAAIQDTAGWGFIDTTGKLVIKPQFEFVESFSDGFARVSVYEDGATRYAGTINREGEWVFKEMQSVDRFYEGLAAAEMNDKCGYINTKGEWVVAPVYDFTGGFSEGLGSVKVEGNGGFIDATGKMVIEPTFKRVTLFREGVAIFEEKIEGQTRYGLINRKGEIVVEPKFSNIYGFSEGLACAYDLPPLNDREQWMLGGAIDATGRYVINPQFAFIEMFQHGLARVRIPKMKDQKDTYYIDKTGKIVWSSLY